VSRYQKGKTNLDFTEARDSEWQWHQLDNMQVCTSLQTDNHTSTPPVSTQHPMLYLQQISEFGIVHCILFHTNFHLWCNMSFEQKEQPTNCTSAKQPTKQHKK